VTFKIREGNTTPPLPSICDQDLHNIGLNGAP
jgi:hypothetical protein